jgi:LmbE family N-acetylglucosaminyl deacetylase
VAKPIHNLAAVGHRKMATAARLLGAELFCAGVSDSTSSDADVTRRKRTPMFRRFRSTLVLAHTPEDRPRRSRSKRSSVTAANWRAAKAKTSRRLPI